MLHRISTHPSPEFSLTNDFAHSAFASSHAAPQKQADGLAVGVQLALVPPAPQHLCQLSQSHQPRQNTKTQTDQRNKYVKLLLRSNHDMCLRILSA